MNILALLHVSCLLNVASDLSNLNVSEHLSNPQTCQRKEVHKSEYKQRFTAESRKSKTIDLPCPLDKLLSTIKDGLVMYWNI